MTNPYESPRNGLAQRAFGYARLIRSAFLFRVIEFDPPFIGQLQYSSWWWRQRIDINGHNVWFRISWLRIHRQANFVIPASLDPRQPNASIDIDFARGSVIRRFRFWIDGELVYEELN